MSNFPILPTTPPPLDFDGSEEEEELEFRTFNDVSQEEEKDIDFVVPDFNPENESEEKTSFDHKIAFEDKTSEEELDNRSIDEKTNNSCDNDFEKEFEILKNDDNSDKSTSNSNDIHLDSNQNQFKEYVLKNDIFEKSSEDEEKFVSEEIKHFSDNCLNNNNENDFDFADFTSYESTKCEENSDPSKDFSDENQSISFYKSELSFGDSRDESNFNAINDSKINENNLNNTESDDDFADFASAQPVLNTHLESDFKPNFSQTKQSDQFDDQFADFSSFQDNNTNNGFIDNSTISSNQTSTQEKQKITEMFAQVFPTQESNDSVENSLNISRDLFNSAELNRFDTN